MIELYINGYLADTDGDQTILFQKTLTQYTNPTIVKNSFTKSIDLPGTKNNDKIFNMFWKSDYSVSSYFGSTTFNPSKRVPFFMLRDGQLIEKGYVKLNSVKVDGYDRTYTITLYGELGNVLYGLSYKSDTEKMTLADLDFNIDSTFTIYNVTVEQAWERLDALDTGDASMWDTINFMPAYEGVPDIDDFDPKKCLIDTSTLYPDGFFVNGQYTAHLPRSMDKDGNPSTDNYYTTLTIPGIDGGLAMVELDRDVTGMEIKDFRSYLQRPIVRLSKLIEAIGRKVKDMYGYDLILEGDLFSSPEYTNAWLTLPLMYENIPDIKSFDMVDVKDLFKGTSSPSDYLISFCKSYGLYIDVDIVSNSISIKTRDKFYTKEVVELPVSDGSEISIVPTSFDKASYDFAFKDSEAYPAKQYKEDTGVVYGSKRVNTGFEFDSSSESFIQNISFSAAADTLDASDFNRYSYMPSPFMRYLLNEDLKYGLFRLDTTTYTYETKFSPIAKDYIASTGYLGTSNRWAGFDKNIWYDAFPKVSFASEDGKSVDGKDVIVVYNGKKKVQVYNINYSEDITSTDSQIQRDAKKVVTINSDLTGKFHYCITDDIGIQLDDVKRCWTYIGVSSFDDIAIQTNTLPMFTKSEYDLAFSSSKKNWLYNDLYSWTSNGGSIVSNSLYNGITWTSNSNSVSGPSEVIDSMVSGHRYLMICCGYVDSTSKFSTLYPKFAGSTVVSSKNAQQFKYNIFGSICDYTSNSESAELTFIESNATGAKAVFSYVYLYDLTELGYSDIDDFNTAVEIFGYAKGNVFNIKSIQDFSVPSISYVPTVETFGSKDIYNISWKAYISDLFSVDTKIITCKAIIKDYIDCFKNFYLYDDTLWVISEVSDYDYSTSTCTIKLIKVNDMANYTGI